jgi:hypothetical protein
MLMPLRKCPKCELNYILDDSPYCSVCIKEMKGIDHHDDDGEICPLCAEREVAFGEEYCSECLSELKKLDSKHVDEEVVEEDEESDVIEGIEDLAIDADTEVVPPFELEQISEELTDDEIFPEEEDGLAEDEEEFADDSAEPFEEEDDD